MLNNVFINVGFGNMVNVDKIVSIINPDPAPSKRLISEFREQGKLIDATAGRRTRSIIVTNGGYIILSSLQPETITQRVKE